MDGCWRDEETAGAQFPGIVGKHGRDRACIVLVDTEMDAGLALWPKPAAFSAT